MACHFSRFKSLFREGRRLPCCLGPRNPVQTLLIDRSPHLQGACPGSMLELVHGWEGLCLPVPELLPDTLLLSLGTLCLVGLESPKKQQFDKRVLRLDQLRKCCLLRSLQGLIFLD